ncbi:hypothetical protein BDD12DRAFT_803242 [Trichophaea hybrida]|nr:hypothetical protein BDD12DRAFT_803242 [Trichophaea hybrida]
MGHQLADRLRYTVCGRCETRYDWLNATDTQHDSDIYGLWGNFSSLSTRFTNVSVASEARYPPYLQFVARSGTFTTASKTANGYEFAIVPFTSHRISNFPNPNDLWYATENITAAPDKYTKHTNASYQIQRGRPPMFCWQKDTYSLGEHWVDNVANLSQLPGLSLSPFLRNYIFPVELGAPPIIQIANNFGYDSTSLPIDVNSKVINATLGNAVEDLTRQAAGILNLATDDTGKVPDYNADFILDSKDVAALSVLVLVSVPCVCAVVWLIIIIRINYGAVLAKNTGWLSQHNLRLLSLQATQLYRFLDEEISGERKWSGRMTQTPFIRDIDKDGPSFRDGETERNHFLPVSGKGPGIRSRLR